MAEKSVIIIGAGIAGLSAGCYLQMNGYSTQIFELHSIPGGLCTAWQRKGYTITNSTSWVQGSSPSDAYYRLWNELIDMKKLRFVDHSEYLRVEDGHGSCIRILTDLDELERELLAKAPEDKRLIREFVGGARRFAKLDMPVDLVGMTGRPSDLPKMASAYLRHPRATAEMFFKWSRISLGEYAGRCRNPLLSKAFEQMFPLAENSVFFMIMTLSSMHKKGSGYPIGGSLEFARLIEERYLELGGRVLYKTRVAKITTSSDSATGVVLANGESHRADIIVSAADGHSTIFQMLEGKYVDRRIKEYYGNWQVCPSYIRVSLGLSRGFTGEPPMLVFPMARPLIVDHTTTHEDITFEVFNFDPTLAPEGKTVLGVILMTNNFEYWDGLRRTDTREYRAQKERIADQVISTLEQRYPGLRSDIEMIDVSTPATVDRYTNNWRGSPYGWVFSPKVTMSEMRRVLPGLRDFYMAGQWVTPGGGVNMVMKSGRDAAMIICRDDGKRFRTEGFGA